MRNEQIIKEITRQWETIIQSYTEQAKLPVNGRVSYVCPLCSHGKNGDGITATPETRDTEHPYIKCFGCGVYEDILGWICKIESCKFSEAVKKATTILGISTIPENKATGGSYRRKKQKSDELAINEKIPSKKGLQDVTDYCNKCRSILEQDSNAAEYLSFRGISLETAKANGIGYDPEADPAQSGYKSPRLIIQTSSHHYIARSIQQDIEKKYRVMNNKGGEAYLFNSHYLTSKRVPNSIFIVEGWADALSLEEVGSHAIALNSTSNIMLLIDILKSDSEKFRDTTFLLCLDNDNAGIKAREELSKNLTAMNFSHFVSSILGKNKDANEALMSDREAFIEAVKKNEIRAGTKPDSIISYFLTNFQSDLAGYLNPIPTGFAQLDEQIGGGLFPGLYILAAVSSLGKTSYALQLADQIALAGGDVIFVSLEMSRLELLTKNISRRIAKSTQNFDGNKFSYTSLKIRQTARFDKYLHSEFLAYCNEIDERLSILEGNFACDISFVCNYVRRYIRQNNTLPVVIVDYLQVLPPDEVHKKGGVRESVDYVTITLKRLARETQIPVIAISSVNRASYSEAIDFTALKESGSLEFTSDVVLGMQLKILSDDITTLTDKDSTAQRKKLREAKAENPRKIEITVLKNRFGRIGGKCNYLYYPQCDWFQESNTQFDKAGNIQKA